MGSGCTAAHRRNDRQRAIPGTRVEARSMSVVSAAASVDIACRNHRSGRSESCPGESLLRKARALGGLHRRRIFTPAIVAAEPTPGSGPSLRTRPGLQARSISDEPDTDGDDVWYG